MPGIIIDRDFILIVILVLAILVAVYATYHKQELQIHKIETEGYVEENEDEVPAKIFKLTLADGSNKWAMVSAGGPVKYYDYPIAASQSTEDKRIAWMTWADVTQLKNYNPPRG